MAFASPASLTPPVSRTLPVPSPNTETRITSTNTVVTNDAASVVPVSLLRPASPTKIGQMEVDPMDSLMDLMDDPQQHQGAGCGQYWDSNGDTLSTATNYSHSHYSDNSSNRSVSSFGTNASDSQADFDYEAHIFADLDNTTGGGLRDNGSARPHTSWHTDRDRLASSLSQPLLLSASSVPSSPRSHSNITGHPRPAPTNESTSTSSRNDPYLPLSSVAKTFENLGALPYRSSPYTMSSPDSSVYGEADSVSVSSSSQLSVSNSINSDTHGQYMSSMTGLSISNPSYVSQPNNSMKDERGFNAITPQAGAYVSGQGASMGGIGMTLPSKRQRRGNESYLLSRTQQHPG